MIFLIKPPRICCKSQRIIKTNDNPIESFIKVDAFAHKIRSIRHNATQRKKKIKVPYKAV